MIAVSMGHLALIPALVAESVTVMRQLRWFRHVTLLTAHVPVSLGSMDRTATSVHLVTGTTVLMVAGSVSVRVVAATLAQESVDVQQV